MDSVSLEGSLLTSSFSISLLERLYLTDILTKSREQEDNFVKEAIEIKIYLICHEWKINGSVFSIPKF